MTPDITSCKSSIEMGDPAAAVGDGSKSPRYVTLDCEDGAIVCWDEGGSS